MSNRKEEIIPLPPKYWILKAGPHDFYRHGREYFQFFKRFCNLQPNERILDVGCGVGRLAVPITKYLNEEGTYEGFDIMPFAIEWAKKEISSRYPNFRFRLVDVYNKEYNPKGKIKASKFKFPYESESFNFVFLHSVFTHMLQQDMENYFSEIIRVLKREGRCLITWFLLNKESVALIKTGKSILNMRFRISPVCRSINKKQPEKAVSYDEKYVRELYRKNGLTITGIHYGSWSGRKKYLHIQDIICAGKKESVIVVEGASNRKEEVPSRLNVGCGIDSWGDVRLEIDRDYWLHKKTLN